MIIQLNFINIKNKTNNHLLQHPFLFIQFIQLAANDFRTITITAVEICQYYEIAENANNTKTQSNTNYKPEPFHVTSLAFVF